MDHPVNEPLVLYPKNFHPGIFQGLIKYVPQIVGDIRPGVFNLQPCSAVNSFQLFQLGVDFIQGTDNPFQGLEDGNPKLLDGRSAAVKLDDDHLFSLAGFSEAHGDG